MTTHMGETMAESITELPASGPARTPHMVGAVADLPLVETKLAIPWTPATLVARRRLTAKLDRDSDAQMTLVTGPAGAGKSALLASWVRGRGPADAAAWVTLDDVDNDPASLWAYLLTALHRSTGGSPDGPFAQLSVPKRGVDGYLINGVASALSRLPAPAVLVIDNAECLRGGAAAESLAALLRHGVPMLRVVLGTRTQPPLPLGRLRLAGMLTEIGAEDLAFTPAESAELWELRGLSITDEDADALVARTDGLAAAVCFAAMIGQERTAPYPPEVTASVPADDEPLAEFFRAEVFSAEPPEVREFLLRSSVVDEVSAELANALTGRRDGPQMLERLRRNGHFVRSATPDNGRYRYRRPFLDFLHQEASIVLSDELPELQLRAAHWYADHGEPLTAIRHAIAAGDRRYAASLVVRLAPPEVLGPRREVLRELPAQFAPLDALCDPEIAGVYALAKAEQGDAHGTDSYLALVRQNLADLPSERELPLRAVLHLSAVLVARRREDGPEVYAAAGDLTDLLDGAVPGLVPTSAQLRAIALESVGTARLWAGEFDDAERALKAAVVAAEHHHLDLVAAAALGSLALLHAVRGDLPDAAEQADAAVRLAEAGGSAAFAEATLGFVVLGLVNWLRGESDESHRCLAAATTCEPRRVASLALAGVRARLLLSDGDATGARDVLAEARANAGDWRPPPLLRDWLAIVEAELRLAAGHPVTALTVLSEALHNHDNPLVGHASVVAARAYLAGASPARAASLAGSVHRLGAKAGSWTQVDAWLVEALAADRLGHDGAVAIALSEALSAAADSDVVEPFVEAGAPLAALLDRHRELWTSGGPLTQRLEAVLSVRLHGAARPEGRIVEPITERESDVLRYLPSLLTMNEIARELSVSPNTVKSHLRNIYRKLAVGTRRAAVHRARKLGLLRQ
jgi:LuxR family maltose regulon positive regulatory protein